MSEINPNGNQNLKSKYDLIVDQLMGLEISDGDDDYGYVIDVVQVMTGCETYYKVITNLGKTFNANIILHALRQMRMNEQVANADNLDDNVEVLPVGYPDGTAYSNAVFGPRRKRNPMPIMSQAINNNANVGDNQFINITSHVSSGDSFPEENRTIDQILTPEEIEKFNQKIAESKGE